MTKLQTEEALIDIERAKSTVLALEQAIIHGDIDAANYEWVFDIVSELLLNASNKLSAIVQN